MPTTSAFDYAIVRIVPWVERGECLNVGIILFCRTQRFLEARIELDHRRLHALAPHLNPQKIQQHLDVIPIICAGGSAAGTIGELPRPERFHWLVSPRSTIIQTSSVHEGLCDDPATMLEHLVAVLVRLPDSAESR